MFSWILLVWLFLVIINKQNIFVWQCLIIYSRGSVVVVVGGGGIAFWNRDSMIMNVERTWNIEHSFRVKKKIYWYLCTHIILWVIIIAIIIIKLFTNYQQYFTQVTYSSSCNTVNTQWQVSATTTTTTTTTNIILTINVWNVHVHCTLYMNMCNYDVTF